MLPHIFGEKVYASYVWFANAVASEDPGTLNHAKRLKLARLMISSDWVGDQFVKTDFNAQGWDDNTSQDTFNNRLSALATNLVNLGFGD
jgi:hypothetical protein